MQHKFNYRLGIDLGYTSLGWACVLLDENDKPTEVHDFGVRIFPSGRDDKTKTPTSVKRREYRGARRNRDRYLKRRQRLLNYMIKIGLQPPTKQQRQQLAKKEPLELRSKGVNEKLSLEELGRALFHLNQRRGFKSNRIAERSGNENVKGLKKGIDELTATLDKEGLTLGKYLYQRALAGEPGEPTRLKSREDNEKRFTSRQMYIDEFEVLLKQQQKYHADVLTTSVINELREIIFFQRPLKPQLAGYCTLIDGEKRARLAYPQVQQYRIYQEVNNLQIIESEYVIDQEMRQKLIEALSETFIGVSDRTGYLSWAKIASIIGVKGAKFNLDKKQRKGLKADTTTRKMMEAVPSWWQGLTVANQRRVIDAMQLAQSDEDLNTRIKEIGIKASAEEIDQICKMELDDGFGRVSIAAIEKILPYLKQGLLYDKACKRAGINHSDDYANKAYYQGDLPFYGKLLPKQVIGGSYNKQDKANPEQFYGKINSPTVHLALNQFRLVLNELVERYGCPPQQIYIELAREVALSTKELKKIENEQGSNRKYNQKINQELKKIGVAQNYANRMKYKLWEDLDPDPVGRCCPLSGKAINRDNLFSAQIEVEHILPFSRTYDNSRNNKMLCYKSANQLKGNRTPYEAFGHNENWQEILARAQKMAKGSQHARGFNINKYWRFMPDAMEKMKDETGDFIPRQLHDTRYMSRVAMRYAQFITGKDSKRRVLAIKGKYTADLRHHWGLGRLVGDFKDGKFTKERNSHHHHAIDALVIALSNESTIQKLAEANKKARKNKSEKMYLDVAKPYPEFCVKQIEQRLKTMVISHKLDHKSPKQARLSGGSIGQLHEDTNYGHVRDNIYVTRKALLHGDFNTLGKIDEIASPSIRDAVRAIFNVHAKGKLTSAQTREAYGAAIEKYKLEKNIKKVRIYSTHNNTIAIKDKNGKAYRYVVGGNNFAAEIWVSEKGKNAGKWQCEIIKNFEVNQKGFTPKWRQQNPAAMKVMRLQINDMLAIDRDGKRVICRVQKMSQSGNDKRIILREHNDTRTDAKSQISRAASSLQAQNARKIFVSPAGKIYDPGRAKRPKWAK